MSLEQDRERVLADIGKYGCHAIHVQAQGELPAYTYTVGISRTSDAPDIAVFGLQHAPGHRLVHAYNVRVRRGERFAVGQMAAGFLKGQDCALRPVHPGHCAAYFEWNSWLHEGRDFPMLQLVYPSMEGIWPWDAMASAWLRQNQPMLSEPG